MAKLNLGRVGFVLRGEWAQGAYSKLDVVSYGTTGDSYVSREDNNTTLPTDATKWLRLTNVGDSVSAANQAAQAANTAAASATAAAASGVRTDAEQDLNDAQKATGRGNIGAASVGEVSDLKSALNTIEDALPTVKSKNLYNQNAVIDGMWITNTGELDSTHPDYGGYVTEPISVESGKTLYLSMLNVGNRTVATCTRYRTLGADGSTVKRVLASASTVTVASDEAYVQFLFANAQKNVYLQIEYDGITAYEPYDDTVIKKVASQESVNNLAVSIDFYFPVTESTNLIDPEKWQDGKWINPDGSIVSNDYGGTVIQVAVESGKQLYLTYNDNAQAFLNVIRYAVYGSDNSVKGVYNGAINGFEVASDVATIAICVGVPSKDTHLCLTYDKAHGYIPYFITHRQVNVSKIFDYPFNAVAMFNSIGAVGDSYTKAAAKNSAGVWFNCDNQAYIAVLGKKWGVPYANYGVSGSTTRTYQTDPNGLPAVLNDTAKDFYLLALGINDSALGNSYLGTVSDIHDDDYTLNADTFYGNYGKIIQQIKNHAPNAKFCMIKLALRPNDIADNYCDAITTIAEHYGFPVIDQMDDDFFFSDVWANKNDAHPTATGYVGMALAYERLLSKAIMENADYFKFATIG